MIIPDKLQKGDEIRIVAPARSLGMFPEDLTNLAKRKIEKQGFIVTFSKHSSESDMFNSSSIKSRVDDLHEAFRDVNVKAILTVIGGYNSNQILKYLDYELIKENPKILCGYSDITALTNAITAKTGLITYSGPHFGTWAMKEDSEYNLEYFNKCLVEKDEFEVSPSNFWSDDEWYLDQENRDLITNEGFIPLNKGYAEGTIFGGNIGTFNLLHGTEFMPDISNSILFIEAEDEISVPFFERFLQSLIHQPNFFSVRGIVIGRFTKKTEMTMEKLRYIIDSKKELADIPIIANVNFGHTDPLITFPIGGTAVLKVDENIELKILTH